MSFRQDTGIERYLYLRSRKSSLMFHVEHEASGTITGVKECLESSLSQTRREEWVKPPPR